MALQLSYFPCMHAGMQQGQDDPDADMDEALMSTEAEFLGCAEVSLQVRQVLSQFPENKPLRLRLSC